MKLYYGGFGDYKTFTVAPDNQSAIESIGKKINAPFLPVTVEEISEVDGFSIVPSLELNLTADLGSTLPVSACDEVGVAKDTQDEEKPVSLRQCKKCDFACESQGELLKHYREAHPKGD